MKLAEEFDQLLVDAGVEREKDDHGWFHPEVNVDERLNVEAEPSA